MSTPFLYTVRTQCGIKFHIEANSVLEAEQRVRHPAIARELANLLSVVLADIRSIEFHRGPTHRVDERLVFRDDVFK